MTNGEYSLFEAVMSSLALYGSARLANKFVSGSFYIQQRTVARKTFL